MAGLWHWLKSLGVRLWLWRTKDNRQPRGGDYRPDWKDGLDKFGVISASEDWETENPRDLRKNTEEALDAVSFYGYGTRGELLTVRIGRRHHGKAEVALYLKLATGETYCTSFHPNTNCYLTDPNGFNACGLRITCLRPYRKWRVAYNGLMKRMTNVSHEEGAYISVKFSFIWLSFSGAFDFAADFDPSMLSYAVAKEKYPGTDTINKSLSLLDTYDQSGQFIGTVSVGDQEEEEVTLWGVKSRQQGTWDWRGLHSGWDIVGYLEDGSCLRCGVISYEGVISQLPYGYLVLPCNKRLPVQKLNIIKSDDNNRNPRNFTVKIQAGENEYNFKVCFTRQSWECYFGNNNEITRWNHESLLKLNGDKGWAMFHYYQRNRTSKSVPPEKHTLLREVEPNPNVPIQPVISLENPLCHSTKIVGGKGFSLAMLTLLASSTQQKFHVPNGIILTCSAYRRHLINNPNLYKSIKNLQCCVGVKSTATSQALCKKIVDAFEETDLTPDLKADLKKTLENTFSNLKSVRLAVRSSAVGEDSSETSAAGQMKTILGVQGLMKVYDAVIKCWASQFSFTSVQYKRQNGQLIDTDIAVVVQEMVPAEVAGVAFGCDPKTGNCGTITISANYGLGESVVSASADPDTITLRKLSPDEVVLSSVTLGKKQTKTCMTANGGITEENVPVTEANVCCLSEDIALKLGKILLEVEKAFLDPRDIEWALSNGQLFLLQARPITTLDRESDYEITHEMDHSIPTSFEFLTRANTGEVMPQAMCTLTLSVVIELLVQSCQTPTQVNGLTEDRYYYNRDCSGPLCVSHQILFLNVINFVFRNCEKSESFAHRPWELAVFGRMIKEGKEILPHAVHRFGYSTESPAKKIFALLHHLLVKEISCKSIQPMLQRIHNCNIPPATTTTAEKYYAETYKLMENMTEAFYGHYCHSATSAATNTVFLSLLMGDSKEVTDKHFADFGMLLSNCHGVESADIPLGLQDIATEISRSVGREKFSSLQPKEALKWLQQDDGAAGSKFLQFMSRHGHRCINEFDLFSTPWRLDPVPLVQTLQSMMHNIDANHVDVKTTEMDIFTSFNPPRNPISKFLLRKAIEQARRSLQARELSKSICIKAVDNMRKGYSNLGRLMVEEGRLPDAGLIYFFTHEEIGHLLRTRSARLLSNSIPDQQPSFSSMLEDCS